LYRDGDTGDTDEHDKSELALPIISNAKMNLYLKKLAEKAEITEPVNRVWWVRNERYEQSIPKSKVLSSHSGRKTFVVTALTPPMSFRLKYCLPREEKIFSSRGNANMLFAGRRK
jgi:hypothetical protein